MAGNGRRLARRNTVEKMFDLDLQRLLLLDLKQFEINLLAALDRKDRTLLPAVIERDVLAGLEEAQLPNSFRGDPAGGEICDASRRKGEPDIRNVDLSGQDRN